VSPTCFNRLLLLLLLLDKQPRRDAIDASPANSAAGRTVAPYRQRLALAMAFSGVATPQRCWGRGKCVDVTKAQEMS